MSDEKDTIEASEAIKRLVEMLHVARQQVTAPESTAEKGACVFTAAGVTSCLNMTKAECEEFNGIWSAGSKCSPNPGPGECKAGPR